MKDIGYAFTVMVGMIGVLGLFFTFVAFFAFIIIQLRDYIITGRGKEDRTEGHGEGHSTGRG